MHTEYLGVYDIIAPGHILLGLSLKSVTEMSTRNEKGKLIS